MNQRITYSPPKLTYPLFVSPGITCEKCGANINYEFITDIGSTFCHSCNHEAPTEHLDSVKVIRKV